MTQTQVRFGLIGYGLFGAHHAAAIEGCRGAALAAIAVRSPERRAEAQRAHPRAAVEADYRRVVERPDVDIVDVATPNATHYEIARAALEAGKHVLVEKPMALDVGQCDELVELARRRGRMLAVGHELRLSSLWGGVKRLIDAGEIGRPMYALIELSRFPYREGAGGWRYDPQRVGDWILEEPIHFFDLARWWLAPCGDPLAVAARANSRDPDRPELHDNFTAVVDFPGGAYAVISQTLAAFGHHQTAKVAGETGTIWAWWSAPDARDEHPRFGLAYGLGDRVREVRLEKPTGELLELAEQIDAVAQAVRQAAAPPCTGTDGRWSTLLCLAARQAAERGETVRLAGRGGR